MGREDALAQPASIAGWFTDNYRCIYSHRALGFFGQTHRARATEKREANTTILGAGGGHSTLMWRSRASVALSPTVLPSRTLPL